MNPISTSDDIERQLAKMRSVLDQDVRGLANQARTLVDWRYHFRSHPWLYCGGAAALGFMLVPRRQRPLKVEASVVTGMDGDKKFVVRAPAAVLPQDGSFLKTALRLAATVLVRESLGYLMQRTRRDS
jgi:hypothetical protein